MLSNILVVIDTTQQNIAVLMCTGEVVTQNLEMRTIQVLEFNMKSQYTLDQKELLKM
jgi:hypothetical protein